MDREKKINFNEEDIKEIENLVNKLGRTKGEFEKNKRYISFLNVILCNWYENNKEEDKEKSNNFNKSGSKYLRKIFSPIDNKIDVYSILVSFDVTCPARQHAIKKLLCSGIRNKGTSLQDLTEARDAIDRAIQLETFKEAQIRNK